MVVSFSLVRIVLVIVQIQMPFFIVTGSMTVGTIAPSTGGLPEVVIGSGEGNGDIKYLEVGSFSLNRGVVELIAGTGDTTAFVVSGTSVIGGAGLDAGDFTAVFVAEGEATGFEGDGTEVGANFLGGLTIGTGGLLTNDEEATVWIDTSSSTGKALILSGGSIFGEETSTNELVVKTNSILVNGSTKSTIGGNDGLLSITDLDDAADIAMTVSGDLDIITVDGEFDGLDVATYNQTGGDVVAYTDGTSTGLTVSGASTISGQTSTFAGVGNFGGGLTVSNYARIQGMTPTGGTGRVSGTEGEDYTVITGDFTVSSTGIVDLTKGDVQVGATTEGVVDGTILVGTDGVDAYIIDVNANKTTSTLDIQKTTFQVDPTAYYTLGNGDVVVIAGDDTNGSIIAKNGDYIADHGAFGTFAFGFDGTKDNIIFKSVTQQVEFNDTDADREYYRNLMNSKYYKDDNAYINSPGFADNAYDAGMAYLNIMDGIDDFEDHYDTNPLTGNLTALGAYQFAGYDAFNKGEADRSWLGGREASAEVGALNAVANAAMQVRNGWKQHNLLARNQMFESCPPVGCTTAYGSTVLMDSSYAAAYKTAMLTNRFWVGGLGFWEDADQRDGFQGYKYDGYGFITGYDHLFGPVTVGAAFGYSRGDFEDKTGRANDSDIKNYSFLLNASYNHCSGFWGNLYGGYTYSDNNLKVGRTGYGADFDSAGKYTGYNSYFGWMTSDYNTKTWDFGLDLGYDIRPIPNFRITPSVGIGYITSKAGAHDNNFATIGPVSRVDSLKYDTGYAPIALDMGYDICLGDSAKLNLNANVSYTWNFSKKAPNAAVNYYGEDFGPVQAVSRTKGSGTFNVGGGFRVYVGKFDIGANYDYYKWADADGHRVTGTMGISF